MENSKKIATLFSTLPVPSLGELNNLRDGICAMNTLKGFHDDLVTVDSVFRQLMLVVTELAEAAEYLRIVKDIEDDIIEKGKILDAVTCNGAVSYYKEQIIGRFDNDKFKSEIKDSFGDEIADAIIRLFDLSGVLHKPIGDHISAKLMHNMTRPYRHNKQL